MPIKSLELDRDQRRDIIRHVLFTKDFSLKDADLVAQIDPDLTLTKELIDGEITAGGAGVIQVLTDRLLDAGYQKITKHLPEDEKVPRRRTVEDMLALRNASDGALINQAKLPANLRGPITDRLLQVLGMAVLRREDLAAEPNFPWDTAVSSALMRRPDTMNSLLHYRKAILRQAPEKILRAALIMHQIAGADILEAMLYEIPLGRFESICTPDVINLVRRLPDGSPKSVKSALNWAGYVETLAFNEQVHSKTQSVSKQTLKQIEEVVMQKWASLPIEHKMDLLDAQLLFNLSQMYPEYVDEKEYPKDKIPEVSYRMDNLIRRMIEASSAQTSRQITNELKYYVHRYPDAKLGVIATWMPYVAREVEVSRPVSLGDKLKRMMPHKEKTS